MDIRNTKYTSNKFRPYVLSETNWKSINKLTFSIAILPWGATEAHNYHLRYSTDSILAESVSIEAAKLAWENNIKAIVLPTIPYGVNTGQMDISLCMNMNPSTQYLVLKDIVQVLNVHCIQKLVILNAHGGNDFKQFIRELSIKYPEVFICSINWWQILKVSDYFNEPGDHAGEFETSVMMHLTPNLVLPLSEAGNGDFKNFKIRGLKEGWIKAQRKWTHVTKDTGTGDPSLATKSKGKRFFEQAAKDLSEFLEELEKADLNDMYE
jgi:creatinine amidohydrolase